MKVYGSNGNRDKTPSDIVALAVGNKAKFGITAFKFQIENRMGGGIDITPGRTEELIPMARAQLGPDVTLMVDANGGLNPHNMSHAIAVAQFLVLHNYTWFEEPFPYWDYDASTELANKALRPNGMGLALGEQEYRMDLG